VPNLFPLTSARSMYEPLNKLKFGLASSYYDQARSAIKLFVDQRGRKAVCAMAQDTDFGRDVTDGVNDQLKAMNMKLVAETLHKPTDTDFSAAVAKLHDANCDLIVVGGIVRDTNQIISAVRKGGWNVDLLGQAASYDEAVAELPGGASEGFFSMTPALFAYADDPRPAVQEFAKKYKAVSGKEPNFAAQLGYTGGQMVVLGLQNAGKDLNVDSFVAGMEKIKDFRGIFGYPAMSFTPTRHQGSNESFLAVVHSGRWVPVQAEPVGY
jgi:branched-chain amino acid transport system substrate-binding protein